MTAGIPANSWYQDAACRGVFSLLKSTAAFVCTALLCIACSSQQTDRSRLRQLDPELCQQTYTALSSIQGSQLQSPLSGTRQRVVAIVSHMTPSTGLFIEQPLADGDPATSDAIWIEDSRIGDTLKIGDQVLFEGTVAELGFAPHSLTALTALTGFVVCAENQPLPLHETGLPLSESQREALEGMRVQMQQNLVVTNVRDARTRNQVSLSLGARLTAATELLPPGAEALKISNQNQDRQIVLQWTDYSDGSLFDATADDILVNDGIFQFSGVLSDSRHQYVVITESLGWLPAIHKLPVPPPRQGNLRIGSLNVLNYFNGDGLGGGFPTDRGARTLQDFELQRRKLVSAIIAMNPDVLGVMEIENDGYGPESAIRDLAAALNRENPNDDWQIALPQTERLGGGPISVGILYKDKSVKALGPANTLDSGAFARRSRQPLAQRFAHNASDESFLVVVNHFKSKGSCPESGPESNQGDGQACWNPMRVASADELDQWLNSLRNILDEPRIVVLGDFNAMRMEDPIQLMNDRGWIDQVAQFSHQPQHTYNFRGAAGTLDYIFTSVALNPFIVDARVWPINADYPIGGIENGAEYVRSSDHDPVIADFNLSPE